MKNKNFKSIIITNIILAILILTIINIINYQSIKKQEYNNNVIISKIISDVQKNYPDINDEELIKLLNSKDISVQEPLKNYGVYLSDSYSLANKKIIKDTIIKNIIFILLYLLITIFLFSLYNKKQNKNINELTSYLKEINNQNYNLSIKSNSEDNLSILKNEIYKTAIMLNEKSLNEKKEKESLKDSLSDISHQLKTPLTSINLMIDNLKNENLTSQQKKELIIKINHKINNINFLVQSLLKLSKFDANTITFNKKSIIIESILLEVVENLSAICDLRNITINIKGNKKDKIYCDKTWQVEAITNIVKNCIEHSEENSNIDILYSSNDIFSKIIIKDSGSGIAKEDLSHIFERFYKGKNSSKDSIGIGLALAKAIIEKDNGHIYVESTLNKGTTFTIKYFK